MIKLYISYFLLKNNVLEIIIRYIREERNKSSNN